MVKIIFVCLGNICRSPMAEFIMKDMVKKSGLESHFEIASAATSDEEHGNPVYPKAAEELKKHKISCEGKTARQIQKSDYAYYDFIVVMEKSNERDARRILGSDPQKKIVRLLDFSEKPQDIADPWFTGKFSEVYKQIKSGCEDLLMYIVNEGLLYN